MIPCGCWDGDGDGTEGRRHRSGGAMSTEQVTELQEREWEWERRTATEREWPNLRETDGDGAGMTGAETPLPSPSQQPQGIIFSFDLFYVVFGLCFREMEQLIFYFLCSSFFLFFLGVMLSWDFLSRNDEHSQFYWNRFLYIEIDFNKLGFYV